MAKQLLVALRSDDRVPKVIPSVKPIVRGRLKTNLVRLITMLSGYVRGRKRRQAEDIYIFLKSREEESRLEFQRFLHW